MKIFSILSAFLFIFLCVGGCVTTRAQMNEARGVSSSATSDDAEVTHEKPVVKAEELKEPEVVASPKAKVTGPANGAAPTPTSTAATPSTPTPSTATPPMVPMTAATAAPVTTGGTLLKGDLSQYGVDELRVEVARLSGKVEELEHDQQIKDRAYLDEQKKSDAHIAELEKKLKELQPDAPAVPVGMTALAAGKQAFLDGKYDEAIVFTGQALEKVDTGKDAEEATFVRGESYFKKLQYNKAILDYSRFPEKFQKSSLHPKALLRIGECFEALGRKDDAKAFYSDLAEKFPKTAEGKFARKRLKSK